jgi:sugar phosphate isomerase/epimerase
VKDRKIGKTQSMLLGTGDADFKGCFTALKAIGYKGVLTIQAWRGEDYLRDAQNQLQFIISTLSSL